MNRSVLPTSSKILMKRWDDRAHEIHRKKLADVKPQIDSHKPIRYKHLKKRAKREQILEDRYTEIQRENRILLEKMTNIMANRPGFSKRPLTATSGSHSQISLNNSMIQKRSLNKEQRKRELLKITMENQAILKRLQDKQPIYNVNQWESEHKQRIQRVKNICQFPYRLKSAGGSRSLNTSAVNVSIRERPGSIPGIGLDSSSGFSVTQRDKSVPSKRLLNLPTHSPPSDVVIRQAENLDENRIMLYRKGKYLGNGYFLVEISTSKEYFYIAAFDVESEESYLIELSQRKAQTILQQFGADYEKIANSLQVLNRRLILLHPKFVERKRKAKSQAIPSSAGSLREPFGDYSRSVRGSHASSSQNVKKSNNYYGGLNSALSDKSPSGEAFQNRESMLKSRHSAKRPRTSGLPGRAHHPSTFSNDSAYMHNPIETEDAGEKEEERKGRGLYVQDNQQLKEAVRDSSKSRERPGECRKSREEEKPVFEEDPDEEEIYNAEKESRHNSPTPL